MDALRHADAILAELRRTHPEYVLPGYVGSPMDDLETVTLPQALIDACDDAVREITGASIAGSSMNGASMNGRDPEVLDAEMLRLAHPEPVNPIVRRAAS